MANAGYSRDQEGKKPQIRPDVMERAGIASGMTMRLLFDETGDPEFRAISTGRREATKSEKPKKRNVGA